jgi:hypothetical protein
MTSNINRKDVPSHLFSIPELDLSADIFLPYLVGQWFQLGIETIIPARDEKRVEESVSRKCFLISPNKLEVLYERLTGCGLHALGSSAGSTSDTSGETKYHYQPFYSYQHKDLNVEPLVFLRSTTAGKQLFINPDLYLALGLEERSSGTGIWWDPLKGVEAMKVYSENNKEIVEIRTDYLLKYLKARQLALVVGHYRQLHLYAPSNAVAQVYVDDEELVIESEDRSTKATFQSWKSEKIGLEDFLRRAVHLWFYIRCPAIDVDELWSEEPEFDPTAFTFPTRVGEVAPARWRYFKGRDQVTFKGETGNLFMERIYFRQDVLTKYEGSTGFNIADDGSVVFRDIWGLDRSTRRLGDELITTTIGDFAAVPFDEWTHWNQYVVDPPSQQTIDSLRKEQTVVTTVNKMIHALHSLNDAFITLVRELGSTDLRVLWNGSLDSLIGRQIKWVYSANADDDEFLKRVTLTSTLIIDELNVKLMRTTLSIFGADIHKDDGKDGTVLGSRKLLERLTLIATLITELRPEMLSLPELALQAEARHKHPDKEVQIELEDIHGTLRKDFEPLAFLYDLRLSGGLAHPPNMKEASQAAKKMGLPEKNWSRRDYLSLLKLVTDCIQKTSVRLMAAAETIQMQKWETVSAEMIDRMPKRNDTKIKNPQNTHPRNANQVAEILKEHGTKDLHGKLLSELARTGCQILGLGETDHNTPMPFRNFVAASCNKLAKEGFAHAALELSTSFAETVSSGDLEQLSLELCPKLTRGQCGSFYCHNRFVLDEYEDRNVTGFTDDYAIMLTSFRAAKMTLWAIDAPIGTSPLGQVRDITMSEQLAGCVNQHRQRIVWVGGARHMVCRPKEKQSAAELLVDKVSVYTVVAFQKAAFRPDYMLSSTNMEFIDAVLDQLTEPFFIALHDAPELKSLTAYQSNGENLTLGNWHAALFFPTNQAQS